MIELLKIAIPAVCTFLAGYIGVAYGFKHIKHQKRLDFIEKQLREFYSPLLGYYKETRTKSEIRLKIKNASSEAWKEICATSSRSIQEHEEKYKPFGKLIDYDNKQFREELFPLYQKMLSIFTGKMYLAEEETRKFYPELCEFVELWNRWLGETIPAEVIEKIDKGEKTLLPFLTHLEEQLILLKKKLSG